MEKSWASVGSVMKISRKGAMPEELKTRYVGYTAISATLATVLIAVVFGLAAFSPTTVEAQAGTTYYVSVTGDDANDGLSWATAKQTIGNAIATASAGDTIVVGNGTYAENLNVDKRLTIRSENGASVTIIQTPNANDNVFEVTADNVTIAGFTIENATWGAGVFLFSVENCRLENNVFDNNSYGIYLYNSSNNTISNNTMANNSFTGVFLWGSDNNALSNITVDYSGMAGVYLYYSKNNTVSDSIVENSPLFYGILLANSDDGILDNNKVRYNGGPGITLYFSENTVMNNNTISSNGANFVVSGDLLSHFIHDIDNTNTVDAGPILYITGQENDLVINQENLVGWLGLVNSDNVRAENLAVETVTLAFTYSSRVENVIAENSYYGVWLHNSYNNVLSNLAVDNSYDDGIFLLASDNNMVSNATVSNSGDNGVCFINSDNNTLNNIIVGNSDEHGIYLDNSDNNALFNLTVENSDLYGIHLYNSDNNTIKNNTVESNLYGIYVSGSSINTIYRNYLLNNTDNNAYDDGTNAWDNGSEGNWWSDWQPPDRLDTDGDGVLDDPRPILGGINQDNHPLLLPLRQPVLTSPDNDISVSDSTPTFQWMRGTYAVSHRLVIDDDPNFADGENTYDNANMGGSQTSLTIENELPDGVWFWKVATVDATGENWSEKRKFRVDTLGPVAPVIDSPTDGENTNDNTPTIAWLAPSENSLPLTYYLWIDDDSDFSSPEVSVTGLTSAFYTSGALADGLYHLRVRAKDNAGNLGSNAEITFRIDTLAPAAPALVWPDNGKIIGDNTPNLDWNVVTENSLPLLYRVALCDTSGFQYENYTSGWVMDDNWLTPELPVDVWYWRVRARDNAGNVGENSTTRWFRVTAKTLTSLVVDPSSFELSSGESRILTATLRAENGAPLTGKLITWSASDGVLSPENGTTDENGVVKVTYTAPTVTENTSVTITASFAGDENYEGSENTSTGVITHLPPVATSLSIMPREWYVAGEDNLILMATLKDENDNPLENKTITWSATDGELSAMSGTTDENGRMTVTYTAPSVTAKTQITITASFAGNGKYENSSASLSVTVLPPAVMQDMKTVARNVRREAQEFGISLENEWVEALESAFILEHLGACMSIEFVEGKVKSDAYYLRLGVGITIKKVEVGERIELEVSSDAENGRTIVLNLDTEILPVQELADLRVLHDDENVGLADNYVDVLNPTDDENEMEYFAIRGENGIQVLVSIPSFSKRAITIVTLARAPGIPILYLLVVVVAVSAVILLAVYRKYLSKRFKARPPKLPGRKVGKLRLARPRKIRLKRGKGLS